MPLKKYNTSSVLMSSKQARTEPEIAKSPSPKTRNSIATSQNITNHLYSLSDLLPNIIETAVNCSASASATGSASATVNTSTNTSSNLNTSSSSSASSSTSKSQDTMNKSNKLPNEIKARLYDIFSQIEKEFDSLYTENLRLKQKIDLLEKKSNPNETELKTTNISINTNSSSTSTLVPNNCLSPNKKTCENNGNNDKNLDTNLNSNDKNAKLSLTSSVALSNNVKLTTKNRINNLSFPKFKPNAKEFIMQSIKNTSAQIVNKTHNHNNMFNCKSQFSLNGHKDGIWDINCVQIPNYLFNNHFNNSNFHNQNLLIGTASADTTARLWFYSIQSSNHSHLLSHQNSLSPQVQNQNHLVSNSFCIQEYSGHSGSVNSIRFHPKFFTNSTNLILSSSGDSQAHIWQCVLPLHTDCFDQTNEYCLNYNNCLTHANNFLYSNQNSASITSPSSYQSNLNQLNNQNDLFSNPSLIRSPIKRYEGHQDACIAAEWFPDGESIVTASWDRTANVYNVETGKILCNLQHDDNLTNVSIHKTCKIILTSSKDTTFKIWDFRDPICSVQIYQGHNRSVNSAIFVNEDKIATSSDDHTVKIWDLKIMRSPVCTINLNCGVNRICTMNLSNDSTSPETFLCLPLDNRDIKIYNLNGERMLRLPRNNRIGHRRLVTSLASSNNILLSASFDKIVNSWSFDFNPSKSSTSNKAINNNKENTEVSNQENSLLNTHNKNSNNISEKLTNQTQSSSILTQLSNITSPNNNNNNNNHPVLNFAKTTSSTNKFIEKIKI